MFIFVIAKDGTKLMPTSNVKKVRKLLKTKKAIIYSYEPFAIQLQYESKKHVQPIEFSMDAGYLHVGVSVKSETHEYASAQYDMLSNEVERHNDHRKYRRDRRNRKTRYRKARFNNRKIPKDWLAPSLQHKKENHINIFEKYNKIGPISYAVVEIAQFDTQLLEAIESGKPLPEGKDYQEGERYGYDTLREAVFARDNYTCVCCGKNVFKDKIILRVHHLGYRVNDRSNRLNNLASVCTKCHTPKNHKEGGLLYNLKPKLKNYKGAAFMNAVKFAIYKDLSARCSDVRITFGSITKRKRLQRKLLKSHVNDAYCIGEFLPRHRAPTAYYIKKRRNNRILSKFYDAKFVDIRTGEIKSGSSLSCGRTNRSESRCSDKNERIYRGPKVSNGRVAVRKQRYSLRPNDVVLYNGKKDVAIGIQNLGKYVKLKNINKVVSVKKVKTLYHIGGWAKL